CAFLFLSARTPRLPGSLIVLGAGVVVGTAAGNLPTHLAPGPGAVSLSLPDGSAFATALTALVIAQIPLTFGNSVVATTDAERAYFGQRAIRVTPRRLASSIATANILAGLTHGLPVCHGAGGVTAHYRMGARTAGATVSAGVLYLALGLLLGQSLPSVLLVIAPGALAGMLLFVAIQHGRLAAQLDRLPDRLIAAGVGTVTIFTGNLALGFTAGVVALVARGAWRRWTPADRSLARA
ncbi:MAG TPA: molybdate transporter family protein, partial [Solirubrobacterales bacterium]|nr:molybdate transporter family protein [Solirubrobacterales bacterium]